MNDQFQNKLNFNEINFFYNDPRSIIDHSMLVDFSLIRSIIEVIAYYDALDFTAQDISELFSIIGIHQKKRDRIFTPSPRKISAVLDCFIDKSGDNLSLSDGNYHIVSWNTDAYSAEIAAAKNDGFISPIAE